MEHGSPARDAASLLVVRMEEGGPKILMGRRSAGHRFMPNMLVFPGGAVDDADHVAPVASALRPEVASRLQRSAGAGLARALAVAAARELSEEVGLSLGCPPALAPLGYLCRAITPAASRIRFDARFFVVDFRDVGGSLAASVELEAPGWYRPEDVLESCVAFPTRWVLLQVQAWLRSPGSPDAPVPVLRERVSGEE